MITSPVIEFATERLTATYISLTDAQEMSDASHEGGEVSPVDPLDTPRNLGETYALIGRLMKIEGKGYSVLRDAAGKLVGAVIYTDVGNWRVQVGYWIRVTERGKGYAKEALTGLVQELKKNPAHKEVAASIQSDNKASRRVALACGAKEHAAQLVVYEILGNRYPKVAAWYTF